jgi:hypothetical protein
LLAASFCLPTLGQAHTNAPRDYNSAHKNAENYQKHLAKERRKQEKDAAKRQKALLKQRHH